MSPACGDSHRPGGSGASMKHFRVFAVTRSNLVFLILPSPASPEFTTSLQSQFGFEYVVTNTEEGTYRAQDFAEMAVGIDRYDN